VRRFAGRSRRIAATVTADSIYDAGRTSVHVALRAWREEPRSGEIEKTTESTFTFVAIDENGEKVPVPTSVETEKGCDFGTAFSRPRTERLPRFLRWARWAAANGL